jgi:hypothetical protein
MARTRMPSFREIARSERGFLRREQRLGRNSENFIWFGEQVKMGLKKGMRTRVRTAAMLLRDRVVVNISKPVRKLSSERTGRTIVDPASRSKSGQFPRADTTRLMKDVFWQEEMSKEPMAIVGTTLNYGLILETRMNRSFLRRTLLEVVPLIRTILTVGNPSDFPGNHHR